MFRHNTNTKTWFYVIHITSIFIKWCKIECLIIVIEHITLVTLESMYYMTYYIIWIDVIGTYYICSKRSNVVCPIVWCPTLVHFHFCIILYSSLPPISLLWLLTSFSLFCSNLLWLCHFVFTSLPSLLFYHNRHFQVCPITTTFKNKLFLHHTSKSPLHYYVLTSSFRRDCQLQVLLGPARKICFHHHHPITMSK